jgi:hypothetical protein
MFDWDRSNLRKIRAHRISREEAEQTFIYDAETRLIPPPSTGRVSFDENNSNAEVQKRERSSRLVGQSRRRDYVKRSSAAAKSKGTKTPGSRLVSKITKKNSIQIAIRLPEVDLKRARKIATRKGIGYQTLIKMLVHEGLQREAKRL